MHKLLNLINKLKFIISLNISLTLSLLFMAGCSSVNFPDNFNEMDPGSKTELIVDWYRDMLMPRRGCEIEEPLLKKPQILDTLMLLPGYIKDCNLASIPQDLENYLKWKFQLSAINITPNKIREIYVHSLSRSSGKILIELYVMPAIKSERTRKIMSDRSPSRDIKDFVDSFFSEFNGQISDELRKK